jgi:hypothetical protein
VNGTAAGDTDGLTVEGFQSIMHVHRAFSSLGAVDEYCSP